jgi:dTDP-glucose pyrophosphorylase
MTGPTLLIMAAGMGSRYGGLKQIDPVGPNGESIIDYSLYDAIAAGFKKVVFVIRRSFERAFRERMDSKLKGRVETDYAFQELDVCLGGLPVPAGREKPWGTTHAVLVALDLIDSPFAAINADDYYGPTAYRKIIEALHAMASSDGTEQAMVGYLLRNTLSEHGGVSRGICLCDDRGYLLGVTEMHGIQRQGADAVVLDQAGTPQHLAGDSIVSMNFWGFHPRIFADLQGQFERFLRTEAADVRKELYLPTAVDRLIAEGRIEVRVLQTEDRWFGVTYRQDRGLVTARINELIKEGTYPPRLWNGE